MLYGMTKPEPEDVSRVHCSVPLQCYSMKTSSFRLSTVTDVEKVQCDVLIDSHRFCMKILSFSFVISHGCYTIALESTLSLSAL